MLKELSLNKVDPAWQYVVQQALATVKKPYLQHLASDTAWLPGKDTIFNAFSLPKAKTRYILFGEAPYPRQSSANGYAFWDAAVKELWSPTGLAIAVNRATSLRNWIKMLLVARGDLAIPNTGQNAIATLNKLPYVLTAEALFNNFLRAGFLLLNASLVFRSDTLIKVDINMWLTFIDTLLQQLQGTGVTLILLGNAANIISTLTSAQSYRQFSAEHPYNLSFVSNLQVQHFFRPFDLLANKL